MVFGNPLSWRFWNMPHRIWQHDKPWPGHAKVAASESEGLEDNIPQQTIGIMQPMVPGTLSNFWSKFPWEQHPEHFFLSIFPFKDTHIKNHAYQKYDRADQRIKAQDYSTNQLQYCIVNTNTSQLAWMKQVSPSQEQTTSCFRRELPRLIMLDLFLKTFCEVFQKPKPTILGDPRNYPNQPRPARA